MGDIGAGMEYQQTVGIAADDGEDGGGDTVEVVVFTRGTAHAVVLDVEEQSCVIGQAADVLGTVACGGIGGGVGRTQPLGGVGGDFLALGHDEDVAARVDFLAEIFDIGAEDAAGVDTGRVDDEESPLEAADAHFLEGTDDGCLGTREIAAEVAAEVICVDCAFHRRCKDKGGWARVLLLKAYGGAILVVLTAEEQKAKGQKNRRFLRQKDIKAKIALQTI